MGSAISQCDGSRRQMDVLELIMLADCLFAKIGQQERFDKSSRSIVLSDGLFLLLGALFTV